MCHLRELEGAYCRIPGRGDSRPFIPLVVFRPHIVLLVLLGAGFGFGSMLYYGQKYDNLNNQAMKKVTSLEEGTKRAAETIEGLRKQIEEGGGPSAPLTGGEEPGEVSDPMRRQIELLEGQLDQFRAQNAALLVEVDRLKKRLEAAGEEVTETTSPTDPNGVPYLAELVASLRRLPWAEVPITESASQDELRELAEEQYRADWPETYLKSRARAYFALGFLDSPDVDFAKVHAGLIAEQTSGVYDYKKTTYFTFEDDEPKADATRAHRVHDLAEILIAQHHDPSETNLFATGNEDAALAARCLYLGDAGLVAKFNSLQERAQSDYEPGPPTAERKPFLRAPEHLKQRHIFGYEMGGYFAQSLHEAGGFSKVDEAYKNPPRSSSEILHFNLYGKFRPVPIAFEQTMVREKKPFWDNVVGEAGAQMLLTRGIPHSEASEATMGWQGDRWLVYDGGEDGDQLIWRTLWKDDQQAEIFVNSMKDFLVERYVLARKPEYDQEDGSFQVKEAGLRRLYLQHKKGTREVTFIDAGTETWMEALQETFVGK